MEPVAPSPDETQRQLNALAEDLVRRGLSEGGDFFITGHRPIVQLSSEYVGLRRGDGEVFEVAYCDMGRKDLLVSTADLAVARAVFLEHVFGLGRGRGRQLVETGLRPVRFDQVLERAATLGVDLSRVAVGRKPNQVPAAPSHCWVVFPRSTGDTVIGGMDRGRFVPYAEYVDPVAAADALAHLTRPATAPPAPRPMPDLVSAAGSLSQQLHSAFRMHPVLAGSTVGPGAPLDHIGDESGHCLYLLNTPMSQRSLPPTDLALPRTGYLTTAALPPEAAVERVQPWFGQPGGGILVRLPRVIGYYVHVGLLRRFDPSAGTGRAGEG